MIDIIEHKSRTWRISRNGIPLHHGHFESAAEAFMHMRYDLKLRGDYTLHTYVAEPNIDPALEALTDAITRLPPGDQYAGILMQIASILAAK